MYYRVKSLMCIPMKRHDGTLFGVCSMIKDEQHDTLFTRADQHVLELHCELAVLSFKVRPFVRMDMHQQSMACNCFY
jgi:hypothetical protein